jgi:hypothetical protein
MALTVEHDGAGAPVTTMRGIVVDQAQLHGILARLNDLGLQLLLVERIEEHTR